MPLHGSIYKSAKFSSFGRKNLCKPAGRERKFLFVIEALLGSVVLYKYYHIT